MSNGQYEDQKRPLPISKKKIDKAAQSIRHGIEGTERLEAIAKIQIFREFHLYPLMLMKNHLVRTARKVNPKIVVARRLKRLPTIINKLERSTLDGETHNAIKFTRMQDIAGCRAIVKNKTELYALKERLESSKSVHRIKRTKDYLSSPKNSGYGGLHLIYSCYDGQDDSNPWKGTQAEIQLRTKLQHAWATSLEIIDTLENIELKTSLTGNASWRRFFYVAGQLVAHDEELCLLTEKQHMDLVTEFSQLNTELNVYQKIQHYNIAIDASSRGFKNKKNGKGLFLVRMAKNDIKNDKLVATVDYYKRTQAKQALSELNTSELDEKYLMAVLVSAESVRSLKQAYPNYFGSSRQFTAFIVKQIAAHAKYLYRDSINHLEFLIDKEAKVHLTAEEMKIKNELIQVLKKSEATFSKLNSNNRIKNS
ncbi:RelA/SpoT domain-containing protein [Shewanella colwelliana]|uniref:RelA/SpoT domain-containing protein n=1 Tax=Shewanella colwelliana TaxID=23 RepID=UPI003736061F